MSWEGPPQSATRRRWLAPVIVTVVAVVGAALLLTVRDPPPAPLAVGPTDPARAGLDVTTGFGAERLQPVDVVTESTGSGELLPDAGALTILAIADNALATVDVATGDRRSVRIAPAGPRGTLAVIGDSVVVNAGDAIVRVTDGEVRPVRIARDHLLIPTVDDTSIWAFSGATPYAAGVATRVGLDGRVQARIALPAVALPLTGTADRLLVDTAGTITALAPGGDGQVIARGTALATDGERLAHLECDGRPRCAIVLGTVDDPDRVRTTLDPQDLPAGFAGLPIGEFSPDGRWLALPRYRAAGLGRLERAVVTVLDTATGAEVFRAEGATTRPYDTPLAWSPDSEWLLFVSGRRVSAWRAGERRALPVDVDLGIIEALAVR